MNYDCAVKGENISKKFKTFTLDIPDLRVPKGFATALIGENGAGKTTLLNMLSGIRLDYKGELTFFDNFDRDEFERYCRELAIFPDSPDGVALKKKCSALSDGTRTKLMLAGVMARDTDLLLLDEPASPLDPLMRDKLCQMIGDYISDGAGEKSVLFSTHNISDMESITDYAIIMEHGNVVECGFVEDLKEKYILIKGDAQDAETASKILYTMTKNPYGFEGICLAENLDKLAGMNVSKEIPSLFQISVAVMKNNTKMVLK